MTDQAAWVSGCPTNDGPSTISCGNASARARYIHRWISHQVSRGSRCRMARTEMIPIRHMMPRATAAISTSGYLLIIVPASCQAPVRAAAA